MTGSAWHGGMARALSLLLAVTSAGVLLLYPFALGRSLSTVDHSLLPIFLLGVSGGFVHGVGFVPVNVFARTLFHPSVVWGLMILSGLTLFAL